MLCDLTAMASDLILSTTASCLPDVLSRHLPTLLPDLRHLCMYAVSVGQSECCEMFTWSPLSPKFVWGCNHVVGTSARPELRKVIDAKTGRGDGCRLYLPVVTHDKVHSLVVCEFLLPRNEKFLPPAEFAKIDEQARAQAVTRLLWAFVRRNVSSDLAVSWFT